MQFTIIKYEIIVVSFVALLIFLLIGIAYLTLLERKFMASIQRRRGPNVVGIFGLLQPIADGVKLIVKETILPSHSNTLVYVLAPIFTFFCSLVLWLVLPFGQGHALYDFPLGLLYILAISSLSIYGIIFSGWSSNSKYAFLGGLRSAAQMISYELSMGLVLLCVILVSGSFHLGSIIESQVYSFHSVTLFPIWIIFIVCILAETNRAPFDLPEAEAELVAGYNVEYSSLAFALFFLGEYANILFMSALSTILFLGGYLPIIELIPLPGILWFTVKCLLHALIFIWVRATFPRFRYDQLMKLGWKYLLPLSLSFLLVESSILIIINPY
uniref:NADH-ubiquinone oxidoreductase chain 1 n=1 Tax=Pharyngomonas kirbyi TaxID=63601 RepID=A0A1W6R291_9EUKA|nr:NADH dehydrogenase subunit 1 [Pharyngomonas kirbyi]ARO48012.1 NADH dehydrogenase subunit 1 [Pharyngomonas kirbyi]|eukprot:gb/GECH01011859.1/.p1 GENE.gb/GECH01011859.1/~~gb/GECH01011859.1/.p1  ORF type:complete len:328 (+),score=-17.16 gb/GECH01011859.1/:1-984(+)